MQLTLHGWPLYRYAGDSASGQTNGEGIGGTWFAVKPTGAKALPANANTNTGTNTSSNANTGNTTPSSAPSSNGGGYGY